MSSPHFPKALLALFLLLATLLPSSQALSRYRQQKVAHAPSQYDGDIYEYHGYDYDNNYDDYDTFDVNYNAWTDNVLASAAPKRVNYYYPYHPKAAAADGGLNLPQLGNEFKQGSPWSKEELERFLNDHLPKELPNGIPQNIPQPPGMGPGNMPPSAPPAGPARKLPPQGPPSQGPPAGNRAPATSTATATKSATGTAVAAPHSTSAHILPTGAPKSQSLTSPAAPPEFQALQAAAAECTGPSCPKEQSTASEAVDSIADIQSTVRSINVYNTVTAIILIVTGFLFVFFGHTLFKLVLFLAGAYFGSVISFITLSAIESRGVNFGSNRDLIFLIVTILFSLLIGSLFLCAWKLGLFAIGAMTGFTIAMIILAMGSHGLISNGIGRSIFIAVLSIIGGIAILFMERPLLILGTSLGGAFALMIGVDVFTKAGLVEAARSFLAGQGVYEVNKWVYLELGGVLLLAAVGIAVQWRSKSRKDVKHVGGGAHKNVGKVKPSKGEMTKLVAKEEKITIVTKH